VTPLPSPYDTRFADLLTYSYQRVTHSPMLRAGRSGRQWIAHWLYDDAPFCLLAQDSSIDPRFIYANRAAQRCFEYDWDEFVGLPSRLSAVSADRDQRERFMKTVLTTGYANDYQGLRISKSGRRFRIENTTVCNLVDRSGAFEGQAALVRQWAPAESLT
jgi:hypothetical protein